MSHSFLIIFYKLLIQAYNMKIKNQKQINDTYMTTLYRCHTIAYTGLMTKYIRYQTIIDYHDTGVPIFPMSKAEIKKIKDYNNFIQNTFTEKEFLDNLSYLDSILEILSKTKSSSHLIESIIEIWFNNLNYFNNYYFPKNKLNLIINILNGEYNSSKLHKVNAALTIIKYGETYSFQENNNLVLYSLMKYIIDIDPVDLLSNTTYNSQYRSSISLIARLSKIISNNRDSFYEFIDSNCSKYGVESEYIIINILHKICSKSMSHMDTLLRVEKEIKKEEQENGLVEDLIEEFSPMVNNIIHTLSGSIIAIFDILSSLIININNLESVLIMPIVNLSIELFNYFSKGNNVIYEIFELNMEALEIMQSTFKLINLIKNNESFIKEIKSNISILDTMIYRTKLSPNIKEDLQEYIKNYNYKENIDEEDYPSEYMDPLISCPIQEPVMLPNVHDMFFDKNSIISQLFHNKKNPYTNEPLSLNDFYKFNNLEEIKNKNNELKNKILDWKKNKK